MSDAATDVEGAEPQGSAALLITYFTDPLCCWSWAFEPQWRLLRYAFAGRLAWRIRMGGMIARWEAYDDPINSVHRPGQMGPLWMQAERVSGMPMDTGVWTEDPPASSWPAGKAFKAAELQSAVAGDVYLRRMREAVMLEKRNIARREVLVALARECARACPEDLDAERFEGDLDGPAVQDAFREDIREARYLRIGRFPALVVERPGGGRADFLVGWRPYAALREAVVAIAPELGSGRRPASADAYRAVWPYATQREIDEALPASRAENAGPANQAGTSL